MSHQDKISANNAFWREMLDQVPCTNLIFRIDENDQAQLFFVNGHIRKDLGFSPEEYVLGSESEGTVASELKDLVEKIASLSHTKSKDRLYSCTLTSRDNDAVSFSFDFRVFQSRVSRINLISVSLFPKTESSNESSPAAVPSGANLMSLPLVAESDVTKSVVDRADDISRKDSHTILFGETGTGRKTLARRMLDTIRLTGDKHTVFEIHPNGADTGFLEKLHTIEGFRELQAISVPVIVFISDLQDLKKGDFPAVISLVNARNEATLSTRLIVTSRYSIEQLAEKNLLPSDLLYTHTFISIAVPPLRHRREDIPVLAEKWTEKLTSVLGLKPVEFTEAQLFQLQEQSWPENLHSLFGALRHVVLNSKNGRPDIRSASPSREESGGAKFHPEKTEDVLTFDDMNRNYLQQVLRLTNGKIYGDDGAAAMLGMRPTTLQSKLKKLKVR